MVGPTVDVVKILKNLIFNKFLTVSWKQYRISS